jgi:hypothetical protein
LAGWKPRELPEQKKIILAIIEKNGKSFSRLQGLAKPFGLRRVIYGIVEAP